MLGHDNPNARLSIGERRPVQQILDDLWVDLGRDDLREENRFTDLLIMDLDDAMSFAHLLYYCNIKEKMDAGQSLEAIGQTIN